MSEAQTYVPSMDGEVSGVQAVLHLGETARRRVMDANRDRAEPNLPIMGKPLSPFRVLKPSASAPLMMKPSSLTQLTLALRTVPLH